FSRMLRASFDAGTRPAVIAPPLVRARFICKHARELRLRPSLQVMVEERLHYRAAEPACRVAFEMKLADAAAFTPRPAMVPGSQDQMDHLTRAVLACQGPVQRRATVNVFLIKQAGDDQHWHAQWLFRQQLVHRLVLPEGIVRGVVREGAPEAKLFQ